MLPVCWLGTPEAVPRCVGRWRFARRGRRPPASVGHRGGARGVLVGLKRGSWAAAAVAGGVLGATAALVVAHRPPSVTAAVKTRAAALPVPPAGWTTTRTGGWALEHANQALGSRSRTRCGNGLGAADGGPSFEARAPALLRRGRRRVSDRRDIPGRWRSDPRVGPCWRCGAQRADTCVWFRCAPPAPSGRWPACPPSGPAWHRSSWGRPRGPAAGR